MSYETILYAVDGPIATITLNRPESLNTIVPPMPDEVQDAVHAATRDSDVKVIVVRGAGRAFCAGYDFGGGFHHWDEHLTTDGEWDPGKDFAMATDPGMAPTQKFLSVWRTSKPVIAQVHGWCVGGGSDFALGADLVIASEDAQIGTPYSRMWGAYLSGMWIYRLGLTRAKEHALTGRPFSGRRAADIELITEAVPFAQLEARVRERALELARIPSSQLAAMKLVVNHAYEQMGLNAVQTLGPILDGLMRNTPDAKRFIELAEQDGVRRDGRRARRCLADYGQAPDGRAAGPAQRDRALSAGGDGCRSSSPARGSSRAGPAALLEVAAVRPMDLPSDRPTFRGAASLALEMAQRGESVGGQFAAVDGRLDGAPRLVLMPAVAEAAADGERIDVRERLVEAFRIGQARRTDSRQVDQHGAVVEHEQLAVGGRVPSPVVAVADVERALTVLAEQEVGERALADPGHADHHGCRAGMHPGAETVDAPAVDRADRHGLGIQACPERRGLRDRVGAAIALGTDDQR